MVILKSQTRVKLTRPQLKTHVRGVQNTQDHFKGPHWTRVLSGSVPRISDARPPPQAANAHTGQNRSTERYTRKICRIPSGTAPHARIRTAQEHGLAPQGKRERALDVPDARIAIARAHANNMRTSGATVRQCVQSATNPAHHHTQLRTHASEPPKNMGKLQRAGESERPKPVQPRQEEHRRVRKSEFDLQTRRDCSDAHGA